MRVPEKVKCDLCQNIIDTDRPWPRIAWPFSEEERERLGAAMIDQVQEMIPTAGRILGLAMMAVPTYHTFDCCVGCAEGFMPMLDELKKIAFRDSLKKIVNVTRKKSAEQLESTHDGDDDKIH